MTSGGRRGLEGHPPQVLGAVGTEPPHDEDRAALQPASLDGDLEPFARLELGPTLLGEPVSFDPVLNRLPGLEQYELVSRLRSPAYRAARRSRAEPAGPEVR